MLQKPPECSQCTLEFLGQGFAHAEGSGANGVLLLGEKLGFYEARDGLPFRPFASAGNMLEVALDINGYRRGQFRLYNTINCFLPTDGTSGQDEEVSPQQAERDWMLAAVRHCNIHRSRVIAAMKPRVICALGAIALRATTGMAGKKLGINALRGYPIWSTEYDCWVVPTYNPQYIQRGHKKLIPLLVDDIKKAVRLSEHILKYGSWSPKAVKPIEYPSEDEIQDFIARVEGLPVDPMRPLVFDIELHYDKIRKEYADIASIQFSYDDENEGIFFDWDSPHREAALRLLATPVLKAGHNVWHFDLPKLRQAGAVVNGIIDDTLWMYHHFQPDLTIEEFGKREDRHVGISSRLSLQSMCSLFGGDQAWKHLRQDPEDKDALNTGQSRFYGCMDAIMTARAYPRLKKRMLSIGQYFAYGTHPSQVVHLPEGIWTGYSKYTRDFDTYLQMAHNAGVPINSTRLATFELKLSEIRSELARRLQDKFPQYLKPVYPPEGYAKLPDAFADIVPCDCVQVVEVLDKRGNIRRKSIPNGECDTCRGKGKRHARPGEQPRIRKIVDDAHQVVGYEWWDPGADEGPSWRKMEKRRFVLSKPVKERCSCAIFVTISKMGKPLKKPKITFDSNCTRCQGSGGLFVREQERWCQVRPFSGSSQQLLAYIQERGYRQPLHRKTKRPTTGQVQIEQLAREYNDPLFNVVVEYRAIDKMKDTYCAGWKPAPDGRLRAELNYATATGQLAARNPNVFAIPKHTELACEFQYCIEAPAGYVLREYDFQAFHAVTGAFVSRDTKYMEIARRDPHSWLTSILVGRPVPFSLLHQDEKEYIRQLRAVKKEFGAVRDGQAKPAILGYYLDMKAKTLYENNRAYLDAHGQRIGFETQEQAQTVINLLDQELPISAEYRKSIKRIAANKKMIISQFGFVRWFFEIFEQKFQGYHVRTGEPIFKTRPGEDAEDAVAMLVQNVAHGHFRDVIMRLGAQDLLRKYGWFLPLHDALVFCCTEQQNGDLNTFDAIRYEMERPSTVLIDPEICPQGLAITVDVKFGRNRAPHHPERNPEGMRALREFV